MASFARCVFALGAFASLLPAQGPSAEVRTPEPSSSQTTQEAQQYVTEKLAFWQQRLKLADWRISIVQARKSELKPGTLGAISWDKKNKSAVIYVMDSSDYQLPFHAMLDDMELTVVHELVHLELTSLPRSEASRSGEEHAVNGIAEALLTLQRGKP